MSPRHSLERTVPGISCQGCVKRLREAIQAQDAGAVVVGEPAEKRLSVTSSLDGETLDALLAGAGYPPETASSDAPQATEAADKDEPAIAEARPGAPATAGHATQRLSITGMTCASCVKSVQQALERTPGVVSAGVNFGTRTAQVRGRVEAEALIRAVRSAGYDAEEILDLRQAEAARAAKDAEEYRRRLRGSAWSLALAVPLMASMFVFHPHPVAWGDSSGW